MVCGDVDVNDLIKFISNLEKNIEKQVLLESLVSVLFNRWQIGVWLEVLFLGCDWIHYRIACSGNRIESVM